MIIVTMLKATEHFKTCFYNDCVCEINQVCFNTLYVSTVQRPPRSDPAHASVRRLYIWCVSLLWFGCCPMRVWLVVLFGVCLCGVGVLPVVFVLLVLLTD